MEKIVVIIDHMRLLKPMSKFRRDETAKRIKEVEKAIHKYGSIGKIK